MRESAIQRQITDLLAAEGILYFRNNVGAMSGVHSGKRWFMKFGVPGMADLIAFVPRSPIATRLQSILWIECKTESGKQSPQQKAFQLMVEDSGHYYIIGRSYETVLKMLNLLRD